MVGDHASYRLPAQVGRESAGEQRLEAAARVRHLVASMVPAQRCSPGGPRTR
ncbi:hypothetical protein [Actinomycetospora termitidis]|uniref:Uncharacterized protein n=1 Tax=Actinomycetospora termitidis TaxID=3053470 RepID=A0ABT7M4W5_9PSEU|nr:hypothetical protein [Actinomycetospora sp. Odt1-22]MDL5155725.1 hypothetical protein [Actinomycetospora sp. Odt1-22]